jgi:ketosteroid isomerase-like protein
VLAYTPPAKQTAKMIGGTATSPSWPRPRTDSEVQARPLWDAGRVPSTNLDLVRRIYAAWEEGDFARSGSWADPEIEFVVVEGPSPGSWTGLEGMAEGYGAFMRAWDDLRITAHEYRELDAERVLVFDHASGRGRTSGLDLEQMRAEGAVLFHIRDGRVSRLVLYWDRVRALVELGLAPEANGPSSS